MDELVEYLAKNIQWIRDYCEKELPEVKVMPIEGTYLLWLDMKGLGLPQKELIQFLEHDAKLWLNDGTIFGTSGEGYVRLNCATNLDTIKLAFSQLTNAIRRR